MQEQPQLSSSLASLIPSLCQICTSLNNCLPQSEQIQITASLDQILKGLSEIVQKIVSSMGCYQKILQGLEQNLRKHIKNQIELKLYYEHLEDVIVGLRREKDQSNETINNLKTQLTVLKEKEKYYMTISNANTRNNDEIGMQSKIDTITKIKNRLSLNGTQQFYANYLVKKFDKESDTKELREKRQSLANALKQLYQSPVENKTEILRPRQKIKSRSRDSKQSKQRSQNTSKNTNAQPLSRSKSGKQIMNSTDALGRNSFKAIDRSQRNSIKKEKCSEKEKEKERESKKKGDKDYIKSISYNMSSRRNSKA